MCLSVYLGSHEPIQIRKVQNGALGIEKAKWAPPALASFPFQYYLGQQGEGDELGCTCLLAQHVVWHEQGPSVVLDEDYSKDSCPFRDLQAYVASAQRTSKPVVVVCDDSGGAPQECSDEDYDHLIVSIEMFAPSSFVFADPVASFPWRVMYVTAPNGP